MDGFFNWMGTFSSDLIFILVWNSVGSVQGNFLLTMLLHLTSRNGLCEISELFYVD